jgi:hypothetical protein
MSNTTEETNCVGENALHVTKAVYGVELCSDIELEVMFTHAAYGGKIPHTLARIVAELSYRRIRDLAVATSKCIEALATAINRNYVMLSTKVEDDMVCMSIDDAAYAHKLLSAHARNARRNAEQLRRLTRYSVHPFALDAVAVEREKI